MIKLDSFRAMDNLQRVGAVDSSCWLDELEHIITPLAPISPTISLTAAGFSHDSNSCSYLDLTPPDPEYILDDWRVFRDWSCRWKRCSKCQVPINPDEATVAIMDALFHKACVTCAVCCRRIARGDSFGVEEGHVYCSTHFKAVEPVSCQFGSRETRNQSIELAQGRLRELQNWTEDTYPVLSNLVLGERREPQTRKMSCWSERPSKRVRTSFTIDQLDALGKFFKTCRKPTSQQLEELSGVTGLKINVLRVWFQNARAKLRRSFSDQMKENTNTLNVTQ